VASLEEGEIMEWDKNTRKKFGGKTLKDGKPSQL
jgi:hypothetical protein